MSSGEKKPTPSKTGKKRRVKEWASTDSAPASSPKAPTDGVPEAYRISGITAEMMEAQKRVHARLVSAKAVAEAKESGLAGPANIVGSYIGETWSHGRPTGHTGVVIMVRHKHADQHVAKSSLVPSVEKVGDKEVRVDVREFGHMRSHQDFRSFQTQESPALLGASISLLEDGNGPFETGSCGCLCLVKNGDDELVCVLSNNHILGGINRAAPNAPFIQQGTADLPQGVTPRVVGNLLKAVQLDLHPDQNSVPFSNRVDAAVGFTAFSHFKPSFHHPGITFDPSPRAATLHMVVAKEGRTTGTTKGIVIGLNAQVGPVGYGQGPDGMPRFGGFSGQILVEGLNGLDFSQAGDSGSLIVGLVDGAFHPVALLVGGNVPTDAGANGTFGCPIDEVMTALNIIEILDHEVE